MRGKDNYCVSPKKVMSFSAGEEVEVSSDEEGFRGAWYAATLLKLPSSAKRAKAAVVEYHTLLSDADETKPLVESVKLSYIRPLPPLSDTSSFEPFDVVDAFHRDGWWKGVITKVEDNESNPNKYTVVFENPPEVFRFPSKALRSHWVWSNGNWSRPPKQKRMGGLRYRKGMAVEVNLNKENFEDAWHPATILEEVGFNSFLVECGSQGNSGVNSLIKETVDSFHVRPRPPKLDVTEFEILERVDAFLDFCWRDALITKILPKGRYSLNLKHLDKNIQLYQSEIRPHLELVNGAWVSFSRDISVGVQYEEKATHSESSANGPEVDTSMEGSSGKKDDTRRRSSRRKLSAAEECAEQKFPGKRSRRTPPELLVPFDTKSPCLKVKKLAPIGEETLSCLSKKLKEGKSGKRLSSKACHVEPMAIKAMNQETHVSGGTPSIINVADSVLSIDPAPEGTGQENEVTGSTEKMQTERNHKFTSQWVLGLGAGIDDKRKAELAENLGEVGHVENGSNSSVSLSKERGGSYAENSTRLSDEEINLLKDSSGIEQQKEGEQQNVVGDGAGDVHTQDGAPKEAELPAVNGKKHEVSVEVSAENHNAKEVNGQAVSTCFPDKRGGREDEELNQISGTIAPELTTLVGSQGTPSVKISPLVESQGMPFVKSSPIWENIEALEVFRVMPQQPHFSPLIECKAPTREGVAMGHMLNFASLTDKISKMQVEDSRKTFEGYLEVLADLKMHGFDVKAMEDRLGKLLSIKDRHEQLENQSKSVGNQITECKHEKAHLEEDIDRMGKLISELEEQRAMKVSMKVMKDGERIALQKDANAINKDIGNVKYEFECLAATPWKRTPDQTLFN